MAVLRWGFQGWWFGSERAGEDLQGQAVPFVFTAGSQCPVQGMAHSEQLLEE